MSKRHKQSNSHLDITCVVVIKIVKGPSEFPFESFINAWSLPRSCALMIFVAALTSVLCGRAATARAALSARAPFRVNAVHTSAPRSFDAVLGLGAPNAVENDLNLRSELACSLSLFFRGRVSPELRGHSSHLMLRKKKLQDGSPHRF